MDQPKPRGRIIVVGGEKGGTGKTTTAVNLAVLLAQAGRDVLIVDTDGQHSSASWVSARDENPKAEAIPRIACIQKTHVGLAKELDDLATRYQDIIVDAGGRDSKELRMAMLKADLMVVPTRASHFDIWTLHKLQPVFEDALLYNEGLKIIFVVTGGSTNPSVQDDAAAQTALKNEFPDYLLASSPIRHRVVFNRCAGEGLGVSEYDPRDEKAVAEVTSLYNDIYEGILK